MKILKSTAVVCVLAASLAGTLFAGEGPVPRGVPRLDHVFVILMENHGYSQIVGNPNAPFTNQYMKSANSATNYFAIGHPSSTNYLENRRRVELWRAQRQRSGLAQRQLHSQPSFRSYQYG